MQGRVSEALQQEYSMYPHPYVWCTLWAQSAQSEQQQTEHLVGLAGHAGMYNYPACLI
jgi:hypothetical protein